MTDKVHPKDYKFVPVDPDPNFDEKENKRVIQDVIRDTEKIARKKRKEAEEGVDERVEAITTFIKSADRGGRDSNPSKYFGRKELARLRGESLLKNEKFKKAMQEWGRKKKEERELDLTGT